MLKKLSGWERRKARVRKNVKGGSERPRLNVYRSNKHIYAQVIDDGSGKTLISVSTQTKALRGAVKKLTKTESAKKVGEHIAAIAMKKGIEKVVFDRSGYLYHGRVKALADGARGVGLKF